MKSIELFAGIGGIALAAEWARRSALYEPKLCRTYNGGSQWDGPNKAIGNAVAPRQVYLIFKFIKEIHDKETKE
ncbi:hypothetical protein ABET41_08655 [Metabacillus fastidiosus]|uniref:DNA (cytosine-5-)-methyltransferase n=1 Tax=Metabacillus fastidiosus TaxID=1458 RepID=A0ABU6P1I8_9BACI|nr:hypothetical protein [Metabacillus fastidiosus]MED4402527.1 hypothetical protein [Metabacillus fastidiosus]MED4455519.1 hypothetical protein [Metabacillus fastidiosus]MED4461886.1 hypothetical protein [Metabacillus fastidiosus]